MGSVNELSSFAVIGGMRSRNRPGWILCVPTVFATEFCVSPIGAIERCLWGAALVTALGLAAVWGPGAAIRCIGDKCDMGRPEDRKMMRKL
jgi:hypothetical protein